MAARRPKERATYNGSPKLGAHVVGQTVEFLVWAPFAERLEVHRVDLNEYISLDHVDNGYYFGRLSGASAGLTYLYRIDGKVERPDPASRCQPDGVHGPSQVVEPDFEWRRNDWSGIALEEYVFYEVHVGTFTSGGSFDALISRLPELQELGITALELMPVAQFPGTRNWGYDGVYPFAPHPAYGGAQGLKRLIDACHAVGVGVVLDVVYNHLGPEGNYLGDYGPYFTDRYRTPWGAAINFDGEDSDHVVRYFIENALQWLDEFRVDALRLDAVHGIVDRNAQPFLACLSKAVDDFARAQNRSIHLIAESDLNDFRVIQSRALGGYGMHAQWSDDFHHSMHALQTGEKLGYYEDFGSVADLSKAHRCGFVYEGQYSRHRRQRHGSSAASLPAKTMVVCSQNHDQVGNRMLGERSSALVSFEAVKLSAALVLLSPFLPLLFMGEEFCEKNPFLYFTSHGDEKLGALVREGRRAEFAAFSWKGEPPDPQSESSFLASKVHDLTELDDRQRAVRKFYKELIRLRRTVAALRDLNKEAVETFSSEEPRILAVMRRSGGCEVYSLFNFEDIPVPLPVGLPGGRWQRLLDSADTRWLGPGSSLPMVLESSNPPAVSLAPHSACVLCVGEDL